ncbi:hypothetical protein FOCC_FOCC003589 [Frankliniella occidentalis]|nr:hypothetical protein FOCC_FOCC003589 [Frankliniella occidentalis]
MKKPSFSDALMVACAGLGGSGGPAWKTAERDKDTVKKIGLTPWSDTSNCAVHGVLTEEDEDQQDGGDARHDVEEDPQLLPEELHILALGHQHGWHHEAQRHSQLKEEGANDADGAGGGHLARAEPHGGQAGGHVQDEDLRHGHDGLAEERDPVAVARHREHLDPRAGARPQHRQHQRPAQPLRNREVAFESTYAN